jgi:hypothetical protein
MVRRGSGSTASGDARTISLPPVPRQIAFALAVVVVAASGCGSSKHAASTAATTAAAAPPATVTLTSTAAQPPATTIELPAAGTTTAAAPPPVAPATTAVPNSSSSAVQQTLCPSQQEVGLLANFGQSATNAGAQRILAKAAHVGFKNLHVERRSCHLYAVVLPGLKNQRQGHALQREAASVGIRVALDCRSHPVEGGLAAVFGHRRTHRAAVRLERKAAHYGFKDLRVVQDKCKDWEVDLYGLTTTAQRSAFAREAASVGLHVVYEPG